MLDLKDKKLMSLIYAALLIVLSWAALYLGYKAVGDIFMISSALISGYKIAQNAVNSLKYKTVSINLLVTIAAIGAIIIREYWEAAAVTFLFALGGFLESYTLRRTRNALKALVDLTPKVAHVLKDGKIIDMTPEEVKKGDIVVVKPGEKIPVDGLVVKGNASVNQSAITGESIPVDVEKGSQVFSGTINEAGYIEVAAEKTGEDTTFSRILYLVEEAQGEKAPTQKFIERFSKYYTPAVILASILTFIIKRDLMMALTFLVISCPGALVISTPISVVSAIGNAAKHGVIIKGGEYLENLGKVDIISFDKTGTLTEGKPFVVDVKALGMKENELIKIAKSLESKSEHPIARAIMKYGEDDGQYDMEDFEVIAGQGVKGVIHGKTYFAGNRKLMVTNGININNIEEYLVSQEQKGGTSVIISDRTGVIGAITVSDRLKDSSKDAIRQLKRAGIAKTVMLTGDNKNAAEAIARELDIDDYFPELLPESKLEKIKELKAMGTVAMVGDGINDAPSLALSDIGIAMGLNGTDAANDVANVTLTDDNLEKLVFAVGLSRAAVKNIKQNIYFAVFVVFALMLGVIYGKVFLASGMFIHEASVFIVTLNAMRLLNYKVTQ